VCFYFYNLCFYLSNSRKKYVNTFFSKGNLYERLAKAGLGKLADNCPPEIQNCPPKNRKKIIGRQILKLSVEFRNCPPDFEIVRQILKFHYFFKNCPPNSKIVRVFPGQRTILKIVPGQLSANFSRPAKAIQSTEKDTSNFHIRIFFMVLVTHRVIFLPS